MKAHSVFRRLMAAAMTTACFLCCFLTTAHSPLSVTAAYENTHVNTGNQPADLVAVAKTQVGYAEGVNNYNKYAESFGNPNSPWCGYFISWCARQANIPTTVIPSQGRSSAFFTMGTYHERTSGYIPQPGDIMLYGTYGDAYHVSIVEYYDITTGKVHVLDGNWSDRVSSHATTLTNTEVAGFTTPFYTSSLTELTAYSMNVPKTLMFGKSFSISGYIGSPNDITKVTVSITDSNGTAVVTASDAPNAKGYDIHALDAKIPFGKLDVGDYTFTVTATDTKQTKRWAYPFTVVSDVEMTIADAVVPESIVVGSTFKISGVITSPEDLTTVSVSVYDKNGVYQTGGTDAPNAATYDISGIDRYVSFGKLAAGSYTLTVTARSANGSGKWEYPFTVTPTYTLTAQTRPTTIASGEDFDIGGVVTCSETLTDVTVMVLDMNSGETIISASAVPNAASFDIAALNEALAFDMLPGGSYKYRVWAHSENGSKSWPYALTVTADTPTYTLTDHTRPKAMTYGEDFDVKGVVTCSEKLTKVMVMVLDMTSGETILSATATPGDITCDITSLDAQLAFDTLAPGSYKYRIWAHSLNGSKSWPYAFTVTGATFTLGEDVTVPTALTRGDDHTVAGTLSCSEVLSSVTVSVVDESGTVHLTGTLTPDATVVDLSSLDASLAFDTLEAGSYSYVITADSTMDAKTWSYPFTVTAPAVTITLSGETYPTTVTVGKSFSLKGTLTATQHLTRVTVSVMNENGTSVLSASATPNAATYDIAKLDSKITFGKLTAGEYTYVIDAQTAVGSRTWSYPFNVTSGTVVDFTLNNAVYPTAIDEGASFSVSGTITATKTLTYVSISAVNAAGETVIKSENTAPGSTSFRIGLLDAGFRFGVLTTGRYTYVVTAKADGQTKTWSYPFTVGDVESSTPAGDVNLDGKVNASDSLLLYRHVSGQTTLTAEQLAAAGTPTVNMATSLKLYNYISGISATYP